MCVPMCAGRFLYMLVLLLPRGAASGGKRRSIGAAESMASPQAAACSPKEVVSRAFHTRRNHALVELYAL